MNQGYGAEGVPPARLPDLSTQPQQRLEHSKEETGNGRGKRKGAFLFTCPVPKGKTDLRRIIHVPGP